MDKIRIGMCHCDVHAAWYGLLFAPADEQACFECNPSCHYYYEPLAKPPAFPM